MSVIVDVQRLVVLGVLGVIVRVLGVVVAGVVVIVGEQAAVVVVEGGGEARRVEQVARVHGAESAEV